MGVGHQFLIELARSVSGGQHHDGVIDSPQQVLHKSCSAQGCLERGGGDLEIHEHLQRDGHEVGPRCLVSYLEPQVTVELDCILVVPTHIKMQSRHTSGCQI